MQRLTMMIQSPSPLNYSWPQAPSVVFQTTTKPKTMIKAVKPKKIRLKRITN